MRALASAPCAQSAVERALPSQPICHAAAPLATLHISLLLTQPAPPAVGSARGSRLEAMRKQAEADKKWIEKHRARTQRILNEQRRDEAATTIQRFMRNRMAAANPPT